MKKFFIGIIVFIALVSVSLIGVYIAVRVKLGVDLFNTVGQLKTLSEKVDEDKSFPNKFDPYSLQELKEQTNASLGEVIVYEKGKGFDGYSINYEAFTGKKSPLAYSEEHTGALLGIMFNQITGGKITIGEKEINADVLQVSFTNVDNEKGNCDFGVTIKIDLKPYKDDMKGFPVSLVRGSFPDYLYVTSVVHIEKDGEGIGYTLTSKYLTINNLNAEDTKDFFHTLDVLLKIGEIDGFNLQVGELFVNLLIGKKDNPGYVYTIQTAYGSGSFGFVELKINEVDTPMLIF